MGERGPQRLSTDRLEKRGSWLAAKRRKEEPPPAPIPKRELPALQDSRDIGRLIRLIPGYDPYRGAEDCILDEAAACRAIDFFQQKLSHVKGEKAGKAFVLEDWEKAIVANLFGWKRKDNGRRRFRECFIEVARKNGKTPMAAGILLYMLFEDGEPGAEIYGAASEYKQAGLVFTHAWGMVRQEPELEARVKIFKGQAKAMELGQPGDPDYGIYRVISADAFSAHGFNTSACVVDELHTQPNAELVDALLTSTGARRQPLIIYITTSDFEREGSVCNQKEDYALQVRDGIIDDPSFLPVVYQSELEDDWTSEETWRKANPNLGVSVSLDYLKRECKRAQETPTYENTFKRLHLNIRTQQDVRWIPIETWDGCNGIVDIEALQGKPCFGGLDMSSSRDITAFCLLFGDTNDCAVLPFFWIPKDNAINREHKDKVPYLTWAEQGLVRLTDGNVVDYDVVRRDINLLGDIYDICEIGVDPWGVAQLATQLQGDGFTIVPTRQGFASLSAPSKEFEKMLLGRALRHGGNPVLRWMSSNVAVEIDAAGNIKPSKKKSTERIDGIVGIINALSRMIATAGPTASIYEQRGALVL
jgi:phage terminase large subunit-like protein